jgi:hypothetical protein
MRAMVHIVNDAERRFAVISSTVLNALTSRLVARENLQHLTEKT